MMSLIRISMLIVFFVLSCGAVLAQDQLDLNPKIREWFRNPDGSCVQCSIGMCGVWQNCPAATTLLWDTSYGPKVRGGSYPSRVEAYCDARKIPAYNITGESTIEWMKWSAKTGRMSAIYCTHAHFQTLFWFNIDPNDPTPWKVCNNNSPEQVDSYTQSEFKRSHLVDGAPWVVILKTPSPPAYPIYVRWW